MGVLIAASVGAFVVLGLTKSQFYLLKNTQKIESKMKALELTKEIISTLEAPAPDCVPPCTWSKSSCTNTLQGFNDVASTEIVKTAILSATHQTDQPTTSNAYAVSTNYNGVQIKEMKLVSENTGDDIVILRVWFETDEDVEQGRVSPEMARPFDIYAKVNYVAGTQTVESCTAVITSYSTFSGKACADGKYLKGFDNVGIMECVALPKCANNEYLVGFNNMGNKICRVSQAGQSCPSGQYLSGFNANGTKRCSVSQAGQSCPSGQYLAGFNSSGNKSCRSLPSPPPPPPPPPPTCQPGYTYSTSCGSCYRCNGTSRYSTSSCSCMVCHTNSATRLLCVSYCIGVNPACNYGPSQINITSTLVPGTSSCYRCNCSGCYTP